MAHYAFIDENNVVVNVITGRDEGEVVDGISDWDAYYGEMHGMRCLRTSYNSWGGEHLHHWTKEPDGKPAFRKNYAGIGYTYDEDRDAFIPPKIFPSWVFNEDRCIWEAPTPKPDDGQDYYWVEDDLAWVLINDEPDDE
jgi:hypothetical protein